MKMNLNMLPGECTLYFTDVCNFSCAGCSRQTVGKPKHKEIDLEVIKKLLDEYPSLQGFCVAGLGEPTIARHFPEVVNYLMDQGKYVGIITNGTYPERLLQLKKSPSYISISLYGYSGDEYKEYVKVDAFKKVIENFITLKKRFGNVGFSYILNKDNYKKLDKILALCDDLQPSFLNLVNYLAYDSVETIDTGKIITTSDTEIIKYIEDRCNTRSYVNARPIYIDKKDKSFNCPSYGYVINVDGQGNIGGCQRQITPAISYGNLFLEEDPYNNIQMQTIRKRINEDKYPHFNCNSCFGRFNPKDIKAKVNAITENNNVDLAIMILFHEKVDQTIECLKSFIPSSQKIYILNNGSSKESVYQLKKFCKEYSQIKILDAGKNLGVGVGRNYLLQHTQEEWSFFVDNDIYVTKDNWLRNFIVHLKNNPDTEVFIPRLFNLHENNYVTYNALEFSDGRINYLLTEDGKLNNFPGGASIINRKLFKRLGLYDDKMFVGLEDFEFVIRGLLNNTPIKAKLIDDIELVHDHRKINKSVDKNAVLVRYNEDSIQNSFDRMQSKYPNLNIQHEWRNWVKEQKTSLIEDSKYDLFSLTPEFNFGARTKSRTIVSTEYSPNELNLTTGKNINDFLIKNKFNKIFLLQPLSDADSFSSVGFEGKVEFHSLDNLRKNKEHSTGDPIKDYARELLNNISTGDKTLVILDHVIEKLEDPRTLLRELKKLLLLNKENFVWIISRGRTTNAIDYPVDETSYREWKEDELKLFLNSGGFTVVSSQSNLENDISSLSVCISLIQEKYEEYLEALRLPELKLNYLICSNEHGKANLSGGIGSYVEETEKLFNKNEFGILLVGTGKMLPAKDVIQSDKLITFDKFLTLQEINKNETAELLLKSIIVIQYLYPYLKTVEIQDVEGYGYRVSQAKKSGILSSDLIIQICAHGTKIQMENVLQTFLDQTAYEVIYKEKIALENADRVMFPTRFIYNLYKDAGYVFDKDKVEFLRLPFEFKEFPQNKYNDIDTLIFYGKRSKVKGYDVFTEMISLLDIDGYIGTKIKRIILIGPYFPEMKKQNTYFETLKNRIEVLETSTFRKEAIKAIKNFHTKSICVLPYISDNHPYALLEIIETGCPFIISDTGGVPELIPHKYHDKFLSSLNADCFSSKVKDLLAVSNNERYKLYSDLYNDAVSLQKEINKKFIEFHKPGFFNSKINSASNQKLSASLIVLADAENPEYISKLISAIKHQTVLPAEVFIICKGNVDKKFINNSLNEKIKVEFVEFEKNYNFSKNKALQIIAGDIVVVAGDSDIPKNDFIEKYAHYFLNNEQVNCVSSYIDIINESQDYIDASSVSKQVKPLGAIGILEAMYKNLFANESSAFRTDFIRSLNGWEDKAVSSDDVLTFVKIRTAGEKIGIVNKSLTLRIENKKAETAKDDFNYQLRLAANTFSLDKFDAYRLNGLLRNLIANQSGFSKAELSEIEKQLITVQTLLLAGMLAEAKTILDNMDNKEVSKCNREVRQKVALLKDKVGKLADRLQPAKVESATDQSLVSVIVPTYNRTVQLKETLMSVLMQSYSNLEIIVVNDAGEDVGGIIKSLNDKRIKYIVHEKNKGLAGARNTGMQNAKGKYISFLDDDDIFYPNHIEVLLSALKESDAKVVYSDANRCVQKREGDNFLTVKKEVQYSFDYSQRFLFVLNLAPVQCFMFDKACIDGDIRFDEALTTHEDWEFWIKLSLRNDFLHIKEVTSEYRHRVDNSNMVTTKLPDFLRTMKIIYNRYSQFTKDDQEILVQQKMRISELEKQILNEGYVNPVSVVVVTYNSAKDISNCLTSLALSIRSKDEVIIVDNNSSDDTHKTVKAFIKNKKNFRFIQNQKNIGFSAATNVGINASVNPYIVMLNPDTVVPKGWIDSLLYHIEKDNSVGAVGPVSNYVAGLQKMELYLKEKLNGSLTIDQVFSKLKTRNDGVSVESKLLTGFCLMAKKDVIKNLGFLDEKLFLGNDDLDLCWRLRLNNYKLLVATDTFVYHKGQQSFKTEKKSKTDDLVQQSTDALYLKLKEHYGEGNVPSPLELWGMDWFKPTNADFNVNAKIAETSIAQSENQNNSRTASIIVATYNQLEYTKTFFDSVIKNTNHSFEIIFVDNSSTDGTKEFLESVAKDKQNVKVIFNELNLGFPKAINQALAKSSGSYVVVVNNDIVVTNGWLERMIAVSDSDNSVGIVGPISNEVSGLQRDNEAKYKSVEEMHGYAEEVASKNKGQTLNFPRVAFLCTLIKKELIDKIGGLDERFSPGNYEDDDFCLRAQLAGYKTVIAKDVFIHHFGSKSFKADGTKNYSDRLKTNEKIFVDKWGATPDEIWIKGKQIKTRKINYPVNKDLFVQHFERAKIQIEEKEYILADESLTEAIKSYDESKSDDYKIALPDLFNIAGNISMICGEIDKAQVYFEEELKLTPSSSQACLGLGEVLLKKDLPETAKTMFEWAVKNDMHNETATLSLAKVNELLGLGKDHNSLLIKN
ncbi:MAG: glycosyltransferase [Ignavibacteriales bacterium]|nr:MAG: glycosyltransferase [Ignavibacteriales bacterium]